MKGKAKTKQVKTAWGQLDGIYRLVNFVHEHRLYTAFKHVPEPCILAMAHLLAKSFFKTTGKLGRRMREAVALLSGRSFPPRAMGRLVKASFVHMALLILDIMLKAPNYDKRDLGRVVRWDGIEHLDAALAGGKGALVPSIHVGDFFHCVGALALDPKGYEVAAVANMKNQLVFDMLVQLPRFKRLHVVGRDSFDKVQEVIVDHLRHNRVVLLMHDIAKGSNLRVPFIPGRRDFLVPVPQGVVAFHLATGAPVLPLVAEPRERFTRSILRFVDPVPVKAACDAAAGLPPRGAHGTISAAINAALFPYIERYVHCFEEVSTFASRVLDVRVRFDKGMPAGKAIGAIASMVDGIIDGSFEPGRDDDGLRAWLAETWAQLGDLAPLDTLPSPFSRRSRLSLGGLETPRQLEKALGAVALLLARVGLGPASTVVSARAGELDRFFHRPGLG